MVGSGRYRLYPLHSRLTSTFVTSFPVNAARATGADGRFPLSDVSGEMTRLTAILKLRCPHCLQGQVFLRLWRMRETCPVCGIRFERESGYFMMSVFIGYILSLLVILPICITLYLRQAPVIWYVMATALILGVLSPFIFRYARILWLHLDELLDPRPENETKSGSQPGS